MLTEGIGKHPPKPLSTTFNKSEISYLDQVATQIEAFRNYSKRTDGWGQGYINKPLFYGLCGEQALCRFLNKRLLTQLAPNMRLEATGDGGRDIVIHELNIQVKTLVTGRDCLIRRVDSRRILKPLGCELFVFAQVKLPEVLLLGWISAARASEIGISEKSVRDTHWNLRIPKGELESMERLVTEITSRTD